MSDQYVYFIQADESGPIKIGFTTGDPRHRLSALQAGNPAALKLLGAIKGSSAREREFHTTFAEWRLQGEWFQSHPAVLAGIEEALSSTPAITHGLRNCLHCSFCFKCQDDLDHLVAGSAANICDECIKVASEIVAERIAKRSCLSLPQGEASA